MRANGAVWTPLWEFDEKWQMERFPDGYARASEGKDIVVSLARAAPRLLEILNIRPSPEQNMVSERAIDFLPRDFFSGKKTLVFDDSINTGSIMHTVKNRLVDLGAEVECYAAIVDQEDFIAESVHFEALRASWHRELSHREVSVFHNSEIRCFRRLAKPYTLDFPIFEVALDSGILEHTASSLGELLGEREGNLYFYPSAALQIGREIHSITLPFVSSHLMSALRNGADHTQMQPYSKLRLFFDFDNLKLRIAPMVHIVSSRSIEEITFVEEHTQSIWKTLCRAIEAGPTRKGEKDRGFALHRALTYCLALDFGARAWRWMLHSKLNGLAIDEIPLASAFEMQLVFGNQLTDRILALWDPIMCDVSHPITDDLIGFNGDLTERFDTAPPVPGENSNKLFDALVKFLSTGDGVNVRPSPGCNAVENLGCLLPVLRQFVDLDARKTDPSSCRLEQGLSFNEMLKLLNSWKCACEISHLSFAIDVLVDGGMLVPQLLFDEDSRVVKRAYRSGEADRSVSSEQLKTLIYRLLVSRQKHGKIPLSEKAFSKTLVVLSHLFPTTLPFTSRLMPFGFEPFMDEQLIRDWCKEHRLVSMRDDPTYLDQMK